MANKYERHKEICEKLNRIYVAKNTDYGDSFGKCFQELGIISAVTRMSDKMSRIKSLAVNTTRAVEDEKLTDTLLDLANYCIMTIIEIEGDSRS
jgi:hypothetical protein